MYKLEETVWLLLTVFLQFPVNDQKIKSVVLPVPCVSQWERSRGGLSKRIYLICSRCAHVYKHNTKVSPPITFFFFPKSMDLEYMYNNITLKNMKNRTLWHQQCYLSTRASHNTNHCCVISCAENSHDAICDLLYMWLIWVGGKQFLNLGFFNYTSVIHAWQFEHISASSGNEVGQVIRL